MAEPGIPALLRHCYTAYSALLKVAEPSELDSNTSVHIYTGSVTKYLIEEDGITTGNFANIMTRLRDMGCVEQVSKGNAQGPSILILHYPPDLLKFKSTSGARTKAKQKEKVHQQQLSDLSDRITVVEAKNRNLERRLEYLENLNDRSTNH